MYVPYGAHKLADATHIENQVTGMMTRQHPPFTGTGTTSGGIPEWIADNARITGDAQIWRIDQSGERQPYAHYNSTKKIWTLE
jgi:hypothetical protein